MFKNRSHAGLLLADKVKDYNLKNPYVVGIPRGGVEVAGPVAQALNAPLSVILPRKIGAPFNREYAVGAIAPDGTPALDQDLLKLYGISENDLKVIISEEINEIEKRLATYGKWAKLPNLSEQTVILVDDGIATGWTIRAALASLKKRSPLELVLAIPVLPGDSVETFRDLTDVLVFLDAPISFRAVGEFYVDFHDASPQEIISILDNSNLAAK